MLQGNDPAGVFGSLRCTISQVLGSSIVHRVTLDSLNQTEQVLQAVSASVLFTIEVVVASGQEIAGVYSSTVETLNQAVLSGDFYRRLSVNGRSFYVDVAANDADKSIRYFSPALTVGPTIDGGVTVGPTIDGVVRSASSTGTAGNTGINLGGIIALVVVLSFAFLTALVLGYLYMRKRVRDRQTSSRVDGGDTA